MNKCLRCEELEKRTLLAVFTVTSDIDAFDHPGSFRWAAANANENTGPDTIVFSNSLSGTTIPLEQSLHFAEAVVVDASLLEVAPTLLANGESRILNISAQSGDFTFRHLNFMGGYAKGGYANGNGGAILSNTDGALTLSACEIADNKSTASGGAINAIGKVVLQDCMVHSNSASYDGGAINAHSVSISGSAVRSNRSNGRGGGVRSIDTVSLVDSTVESNRSRNSGGGIFATGTVEIESTILENNEASRGGGVWSNGTITIRESTVSFNTASDSNFGGGGVFAVGGLHIESSTVSSNVSMADGGGVFAKEFVRMERSTLARNTANGRNSHGGGMYIRDTDVQLSRVTVSGNVASGRGGGFYSVRGDLDIVSSTIVQNSAAVEGGGLSKVFGKLKLFSSIVASNVAPGNPDFSTSFNNDIKFSLIGDNPGTRLDEAHTPDSNRNLVGSAAGSGIIDPKLGALGDNGGTTPTHVPLPGSPVIDAGSSNATDQTGGGIFGQNADIGAVEWRPADASWHDQLRPADVDQDGIIGPVDALLIIYELDNRRYSSSVTGELTVPPNGRLFLDVDDDGSIGPIDALIVIGQLPTTGSSAELIPTDSKMARAKDTRDDDTEEATDKIFATLTRSSLAHANSEREKTHFVVHGGSLVSSP